LNINEETTMGLLGNILNRRQESADTQVVPAATGESLPSTLRQQGNAMLNRATQFYRENPKKVQAVGLVAAALLLNSMRRGRS
jgi:uncharacterized membrane protein